MAKQYLALDVGERRIGVASASSDVKIAVPGDWIDVDGKEFSATALTKATTSCWTSLSISRTRSTEKLLLILIKCQ